jgi:exodeoxyribonuclease VII small subunit
LEQPELPEPIADHPSQPPTFEHSLSELEAIVHDLEEGRLGLGEALARYEQGVRHLKHCYQMLEAAEQKIELLAGVADDGTPQTQPFEMASEPLAESAGRRRRSKSSRPSPAADDARGDIDA